MIALVLLMTQTASSLSFVRADAGWIAVFRVCRSDRELVYLQETPDRACQELVRLDPDTGEQKERLRFQPAPADEWEGAAGTTFSMSLRTTLDGRRSFSVDESVHNVLGDWAPEERVGEQLAHGAARLSAWCPGGRPLALCFTSRRTVEVGFFGDIDEDSPLSSISYRAWPAKDKGVRESLWLSNGASVVDANGTALGPRVRGKVTRSATSFSASFTNGEFRYAMEASLDAHAPGATLTVFKGDHPIQSEVCAGYSVFPDEPEGWLKSQRELEREEEKAQGTKK